MQADLLFLSNAVAFHTTIGSVAQRKHAGKGGKFSVAQFL
jgi:hypothetical protein